MKKRTTIPAPPHLFTHVNDNHTVSNTWLGLGFGQDAIAYDSFQSLLRHRPLMAETKRNKDTVRYCLLKIFLLCRICDWLSKVYPLEMRKCVDPVPLLAVNIIKSSSTSILFAQTRDDVWCWRGRRVDGSNVGCGTWFLVGGWCARGRAERFRVLEVVLVCSAYYKKLEEGFILELCD